MALQVVIQFNDGAHATVKALRMGIEHGELRLWFDAHSNRYIGYQLTDIAKLDVREVK